METKASKRNGKIEFMRFFFCMSVLFYHCLKYTDGIPKVGKALDFGFFIHGALGVEFFFILSGLLMAKSIKKKNDNKESTQELGKESFLYVKRKFMSFFPYHVIAFVLIVAEVIVINKYGWLKAVRFIMDSVPNFFLIYKSGVVFKTPNGVEWYLSVMLIAMMFLYPICRKFYNMFVFCIAPLMGLMIAGYLTQKYHSLTGVSVWDGLMNKCVLRGVMEIALGATAYELCLFFVRWCDSNKKKLALTVAEFGLYAVVLFIMIMTFSNRYHVYALGMLFVAVPITFSGCTFGNQLFNNGVCMFLGKISLPIYINQVFAINLSDKYLKQVVTYKRMIFIVVVTLTLSLVSMAVVNGWKRIKGKSNQ